MIRTRSTEDDGLALALIQIDGGTQSRATLNEAIVDDYAALVEAGVAFPKIVVFYDGKKHWLADGFHRVHAYQKAGKATADADVRQGTRRDAILFSVGANANHGLRRTNDDKRRAVLTLLNDAEWSKWSDREIARRCAVGADMVGRMRPADTVAERQYEHPKTGKPTIMKTAGINASRTQFQAKASEDNGSITGGSGAVTGEASRLASGRTDAGEVASVDLPTNPLRNIFDELVSLWKEADAGVRQDFKAYITGSEFVAKFNLTEGNPAPGTGGSDVDRSAERASSAVEVGATNSPDGADETGRFESGSLTEIMVKPQVQVLPGTRIQGAKGGPTGMGRSDGVERHAPNSNPQPKTPGDADKAEAVPPPPAVSANPFNNPRCQKPETCHLVHSRNECFECTMAWAKRPRDEQVRLWAEAIQAARAA